MVLQVPVLKDGLNLETRLHRPRGARSLPAGGTGAGSVWKDTDGCEGALLQIATNQYIVIHFFCVVIKHLIHCICNTSLDPNPFHLNIKEK